MKYLAVPVIFLFTIAIAPAKSEEMLTVSGYHFISTYDAMREIDQLVTLLGDDVLRGMVCLLSHGYFESRKLGSALGVSETQVLRRIHTLHGWGVVRTVKHDLATNSVEVVPGIGKEKLGRWASKYCLSVDSCGVMASIPLGIKRSRVEKGGNAIPAPDVGGSSHSRGYWLIKSEPGKYSWVDMMRDKRTYWDGVRNYQASNNLKKMKIGDRAFFYHSVKAREIVGVVEIVKAYYPDTTDSSGRFGMVDVIPVEALLHPVQLPAIKKDPRLVDLALVRQPRLSVMPVNARQWKIIHKMASVN